MNFLPTAREGNVFTGVCHSVHNRPQGYSVNGHPCYSGVGTHLLPPTTKLGQGYIFTGICDSVHRGGLPQCMLGYPQWDQAGTPLPDQAGTPLDQNRHLLGPGRHPRTRQPPRDQTGNPPGLGRHDPPKSRAYLEIWSTSGWYASYWNAILHWNAFLY